MASSMKPSKKYEHLYAVVRYAIDADETTPIDLRFFIVKVVADRQYADEEAKRLSDLNKEKGYYYFVQIARYEDEPIETTAVAMTEAALMGSIGQDQGKKVEKLAPG